MNEILVMTARLLEIGGNLAFMWSVRHGDSPETLEWADLTAKLAEAMAGGE